MKNTWNFLAAVAALGGMVAMGAAARAQVLVTEFDYFTSDALYASWADPGAVIVSGEDSYSVTARGYGSNYKFVGVVAPEATHVELEVTLSGPPAADGQLGPIVSFVDADGTYFNYAWFGQTLGDHVLRAKLSSPSFITAPGAEPGLFVDSLPHLHMQIDPSGFTAGDYTIEWKKLTLLTLPPLPGDFDADDDVDGTDFLLWQRDTTVGALQDFQANYGMTGAATAAIGAVPEPAAAALMSLGSVGLALRMRRRRATSNRPAG